MKKQKTKKNDRILKLLSIHISHMVYSEIIYNDKINNDEEVREVLKSIGLRLIRWGKKI